MFPFDCVEFHTIQHVVPKRDTYNDDLSLLERLCHMKFLKPHFNPKVMGDDTFKKSVDEESFHQIWPTVGPPSKDDRSLVIHKYKNEFFKDPCLNFFFAKISLFSPRIMCCRSGTC